MNLEVLVKRLDGPCHVALEEALSLVAAQSQRSVELAHWLYKLLDTKDEMWQACLEKFSLNVGNIKEQLHRKIVCYPANHGSAPTLSQSVIDTACEAWLIASLECDLPVMSPCFLLLAMLTDTLMRQEILSIVPALKPVEVSQLRVWCVEQGKIIADLLKQSSGNVSSQLAGPISNKALDQFTSDLTAQASNQKLDPVIGRTAEIQQMIDVLLRRKQNNPILTGEPGVGKTACVEGLAQRIVAGEVPEELKNVRLLTLDLTAMQAGASVKGEFEKRLKQVIKEVQNSSTPIILFIDEAHTLVGAGGAQGQGDAANMLKPALARGELRTIAATTWREYKKYFEQDPALVRRFQAITVAEPTPEVAIDMLRQTVEKLQKHHGLHIEDEAVEAAVYLSHRYLSERKLPDKAVSLLDTACAKAVTPRNGICYELITLNAEIANIQVHIDALENQENNQSFAENVKALKLRMAQLEKDKKAIIKQRDNEQAIIDTLERHMKSDREDVSFLKIKKKLLKKLETAQKEKALVPFTIDKRMIADVLSAWTGIPVSNMLSQEQTKLIELPKYLNKRVFGQAAGIESISQSLMTSGARLSKPTKPLGVFLLAGPSGVGKTETALAIAEQLLGSADKITTINMSAFKEAHKASTLTGSPPGYVGYGEGGVLTEAVRREPHSLILLDEMEKAHPSIQDIFYQMLDRGIMRDSEGRDIDFRQTIIVMTSNAADQYVMDNEEGLLKEDAKTMEGLFNKLEKHFKPAFLGRVKVVPYMPLNKITMADIIHYQLKQLAERVSTNYEATLVYTNEVIEKLLAACQFAKTGARQIGNIIDKDISPKMAKALLLEQVRNKYARNSTLTLDVKDDEYTCIWSGK